MNIPTTICGRSTDSGLNHSIRKGQPTYEASRWFARPELVPDKYHKVNKEKREEVPVLVVIVKHYVEAWRKLYLHLRQQEHLYNPHLSEDARSSPSHKLTRTTSKCWALDPKSLKPEPKALRGQEIWSKLN